MTRKIKCPDPNCDPKEKNTIVVPDDAEVGDILECPVCGAEVELISITPLQVALIEEEK